MDTRRIGILLSSVGVTLLLAVTVISNERSASPGGVTSAVNPQRMHSSSSGELEHAAVVRTVVDAVGEAPPSPTLTDLSPRDWVAYLKRQGAPADVVYAVAATVVANEFRDRKDAVMGRNALNAWPSRQVKMTVEQRTALNDLRTEEREEVARLAGDGLPESSLGEQLTKDPTRRDEVGEILADYSRLRQQAVGDPMVNQRRLERMLAENQGADLRAVLSPEDYTEYLRFQSPDARELQRRLGYSDLTDEQYVDLFDALQAISRDENQGGLVDPTYQIQVIGEVLTRFGPEVAATVSMNSDATFGRLSERLRGMGFDAAQIVDTYVDFNHYLRTGINASASGRLDRTVLSVEAARIYQKLQQSLTTEQLDALSEFSFVASLRRNLPPP